MFFAKIHRSYRDVLAVCDHDLLGKKFEETFKKGSEEFTKQLDIRESFYKDKELSKDELTILMQDQKREDSTFNIVGKEAVNLAKKVGIITDTNVGYVDKIPFALVLG